MAPVSRNSLMGGGGGGKGINGRGRRKLSFERPVEDIEGSIQS